MKSSCYPEYPAILFAAGLLGRPVKWRMSGASVPVRQPWPRP